ncbi:uncharacterized protein LOC129939217 [Eupeodes corollae]|uniref:uncharacterized protein LOC129939217 n=1 Tax=Eupeodes corollae TaxID=290404 RepID=UPI0024925AA2|nr:uncharacterized protein LOC129939217 [Eupeodes corollae]
MKTWTDENTLLLIKLYEQHPDLWRGNVRWKNPELRMNLWSYIAEVQETTSDEIQKKIKSLRRKFCTETKRYEKKPSDYLKNHPWIFFRPLMFLLRENEFKSSSAASESFMSESNCSSKQFGTEESSVATSKHQDESGDFESSTNCGENEGEEEYDVPETKKRKSNTKESTLEDALQCIKTLLDESGKRDEHSIYGEHIAHKLRTSNRSKNDIAIAQHHIENIVFNLTMGVYAQEASSDALEANSKSVIPSSVPDPFIIPKPDPDLGS